MISFTQKILSAELVLTPLRAPDIFYNILQEAKPERENLEVEQACRPARGPCKPVF